MILLKKYLYNREIELKSKRNTCEAYLFKIECIHRIKLLINVCFLHK